MDKAVERREKRKRWEVLEVCVIDPDKRKGDQRSYPSKLKIEPSNYT